MKKKSAKGFIALVGFFAAVAFGSLPQIASAQSGSIPWSTAFPSQQVTGQGTLIRWTTTGTYNANSTVCATVAPTVCAPIPIQVTKIPSSTGIITNVTLSKSTNVTSSASFVIWFFSAAPVTTTQYDNTAYVAPFTADYTAGSVIGFATCSTAVQTNATTGQGAYFACTPSGNGYLPFHTVPGSQNIYALLEVTGAYAQASNEVFTIQLGGYDD